MTKVNPHTDNLAYPLIIHSKYEVDSLSMQHAKFFPEEAIHRTLMDSAVDLFLNSDKVGDCISRESIQDGRALECYTLSLAIMSEIELKKLLNEAFQRGLNFQYRAMTRMFGEIKAEEEEQARNDAEAKFKE